MKGGRSAYWEPVCAQCMTTAVTAGAAATGLRAWAAARSPVWLTPRRLRWATIALLTVALSVTAVGSG